jgi:hypothetical protein
MSKRPTDPDDPVARLLANGYDVAIRHGHLVVSRVPYLVQDPATSEAALAVRQDGQLVLPINDSAHSVVDAIGDHTIWFAGAEPRDERGTALGTPRPGDLGNEQRVDFMLSFKPPSGAYTDLHHKVRHYARILRDAAGHVDPEVTATPGAAFQVVEDDLPLMYRDTNTTRAGLTALNNKFRRHTVAIVGLGGTGSYILDQVAKTWVDRIIVVDGDALENHNAFRAPGAPSREVLQAHPSKAGYFGELYSNMHTGIEVHETFLTAENVDVISGATFVFLAAADAADRPLIMARLTELKIAFIDVGMGVSETDTGLTGLAKVNTYLPTQPRALPPLPVGEANPNDYASNIQIADLNALNAMLAVIEWKRWLGFYATAEPANEVVYKLYTNQVRIGNEQ